MTTMMMMTMMRMMIRGSMNHMTVPNIQHLIAVPSSVHVYYQCQSSESEHMKFMNNNK